MENLKSRVKLVAQNITTNEVKQLELASQLENHKYGNKECIEEFSAKFDLISKWNILAVKNTSARLSKCRKELISKHIHYLKVPKTYKSQ